MRQLILAAFIICMALNSKGQITKGNWILGGSATFTSTKYKSEIFGPSHKGSNILVKPNLGFFVIDKLATGVIGEYRRIGGENSYWYGFNIGPSIRY